MSSYATQGTPSVSETLALQATVKINGAVCEFAQCLSFEKNAGAVTPHKAYIRIGGNGFDVSGAITLNAYDFGFGSWAKVEIIIGGETLFIGMVQFRRDRGSANNVIYEAWDFRYLLSLIPVYGCLVYDNEQDKVIFVDRFINRMNPDGSMNCIGATLPGSSRVIPVFSSFEDQGIGFNLATQDTTLVKGQNGSWTPSKALQHFCALANLAPGAVPGTQVANWRYLNPKNCPLVWDIGATLFDADPDMAMSRKMPDTTFNGKTMQLCIEETLKIGAAYGMSTNIAADNGGAKQHISFYPKTKDYAPKPVDLRFQRGGPAGDIKTIVDFELEEDATQVREAGFAMGAPRRVESEFSCTGVAAISTDTLKPAWTKDQVDALIKMQVGAKGSDGKFYAYRPTSIPAVGQSWSAVGYQLCDGTAGAPILLAKTKESLQAIRQVLPEPFRAYYVDSVACYLAGILKGVNNIYQDSTIFPFLHQPRHILPTQLQPYVGPSGQKLRENFPLRVQVDTANNGKFHDVTHNSGARPELNGLIFFDGLTDDIAGNDNLYKGSLINDPKNVVLRAIKLNGGVAFDQRSSGYDAFSAGDVDPQVADMIGGPGVLYIDAPQGWKENHQINSSPSVASSYPSAVGGNVEQPIAGRFLENDTGALVEHAGRRRIKQQYKQRKSSWVFPSIRTEYDIGQFIHNIAVTGQEGDVAYTIDAPIEKITIDFVNQETIYGGLISTGPTAKSTRKFPATNLPKINNTFNAVTQSPSTTPTVPTSKVADTSTPTTFNPETFKAGNDAKIAARNDKLEQGKAANADRVKARDDKQAESNKANNERVAARHERDNTNQEKFTADAGNPERKQGVSIPKAPSNRGIADTVTPTPAAPTETKRKPIPQGADGMGIDSMGYPTE